jgi:hypothetical protein
VLTPKQNRENIPMQSKNTPSAQGEKVSCNRLRWIKVSLKRELSASGCGPNSLCPKAEAIISAAAVGGDNAPADRVTPRNFRKTRKPMMQPKSGAVGL